MQEIYCAQCGASILAESEADLIRCPSCGKNPRELSRAQKLEQAKEMAAAALRPAAPVVAAKSPGVAAALSFVIPGLGQLYNEQIIKGLVVFAAAIVGLSFCVVPGLVVWLAGIFDAYSSAQRINRGW